MAFRFVLNIFVFCLAVLFAQFATLRPHAATVPESCDPDFYDVLSARAIMEARREVEVAETLILKPDSVLELSCFDDQVKNVGAAADEMFSDNVDSTVLFNDPPATYTPSGPYAHLLPTINTSTVDAPNTGQSQVQRGPNPPGGDLHDERLNNALGLVVMETEFNYLLANFGHAYAGGTYANPSATSVCNPMQLVWEFSKCTDFPMQLFRTFNEFSAVDPRIVVTYTPLSCNVANRSNQWTTSIDAAAPPPGSSGAIEPVTTFVEFLDPSNCSAVPPLETGLKYYRFTKSGEHEDDDAVCVVPGCYYNGASCQ